MSPGPLQKIAFIDRDGVLIEEPDDFQVDSFAKFRLVSGVIPALLRLRDAGWQFVLVSNQDGLGTDRFPYADFIGPHTLLLQILESQGIVFREVLIDRHFEHENAPTRKPGIGMLLHYLRDRSIDLAGSVVIGDRETDMQLARNLGCRGLRLAPAHYDWPAIAHLLVTQPRVGLYHRRTRETDIEVEIDLDRSDEPHIATGIGFFDHMLEQIGKHAGFALRLQARGDLHIDEHHTVEDTALALGTALRQAMGDKRGIGRYGQADANAQQVELRLPMDEALAEASLDCSGRAFFCFEGDFPRAQVGGLHTEMVPHFFRSLCDAAGLNLHLRVRGENTHHMIEACFKAVARALRQALARNGSELPSTKGAL